MSGAKIHKCVMMILEGVEIFFWLINFACEMLKGLVIHHMDLCICIEPFNCAVTGIISFKERKLWMENFKLTMQTTIISSLTGLWQPIWFWTKVIGQWNNPYSVLYVLCKPFLIVSSLYSWNSLLGCLKFLKFVIPFQL